MKAVTGYSGTPLWKKLGYKSGTIAYVDGAPDNYISLLTLPDDVAVTWLSAAKQSMMFVHLFTASESTLKTKLKLYRHKIVSDGTVWVSWLKKSSGMATEVTENLIRDVALPLGFVDIKVCAVDEVWSGLKLMIRKDQR